VSELNHELFVLLLDILVVGEVGLVESEDGLVELLGEHHAQFAYLVVADFVRDFVVVREGGVPLYVKFTEVLRVHQFDLQQLHTLQCGPHEHLYLIVNIFVFIIREIFTVIKSEF